MNKLTTIVNDGWNEVPEAIGPIHGKILKFNNGDYILDKTKIMTGANLVVMGVVSAWVKFVDGLPEHRITKPGQHHPARKDLPDQDESLWKLGLNREPEDPWQDTRYLYLVDRETAEEMTFVTATVGGRRAIRTLGSQIKMYRRARSNAGATPIVKLAAGKMPTDYGPKPCPCFEVIGWITAGDHGDEAPQIEQDRSPDDAVLLEPTEIEAPARQASRPANDMDDDIPF